MKNKYIKLTLLEISLIILLVFNHLHLFAETITKDTPSQLPANVSFKGDISDISLEDFFSQVLLKQNKKFYLIGRMEYKRDVQWHYPGLEYRIVGLSSGGFLDVTGEIDPSLDRKNIIAYGYIEKVKIKVPTSKSFTPSYSDEIVNTFHAENISPIEFYQLECPNKVKEDEEFEVNLTVTNPFDRPAVITFYVRSGDKQIHHFKPKEVKKLKWRLLLVDEEWDIHFEWANMVIRIAGVSDEGIIWVSDYKRLYMLPKN